MWKVKSFMLLATLGLVAVGCSPSLKHTSSKLSANGPAEINVMLAPDQATYNSVMYLAAPKNYSRVEACYSENASTCSSQDVSSRVVGETANRKIYRLVLTVSVQAGQNWLLKADGQVRRKITFVPKAGNDNNRWRVVLLAADKRDRSGWIQAFDNARVSLRNMFTSMGVSSADIQELSIRPEYQSASVKPANSQNFRIAVESMKPGPQGACLIHMTSHGSRGSGFNMGRQRLAPSTLGSALDRGCGDRPTVVLISACYAGEYLRDVHKLKKPNRIILTASAHDKTSFGCSAENQYTYWDGCLIDEALPNATSWSEVAQKTEQCIIRKEGGSTRSYPLTFIGSDVANLGLPSGGVSVPAAAPSTIADTNIN